MVIYKIENKINGKCYIGQTKFDVSKRVAAHSKSRRLIGKAIRKYGIQSFDISIIDTATSAEVLSEKEVYWIKTLDSKAPNGYNLTDGGEGLINPSQSVKDQISKNAKRCFGNQFMKGVVHKEESKEKISNSLKIRWQDEEFRERMIESAKSKPPFSEETKQKISEAKTGKPRSDAHLFSERVLAFTSKEDYVNPMKGKKRPDLAERNRQRKGTKLSEETKQKMSESRKGKPKSKEHVEKIKESRKRNKELKLVVNN